jgi:hypothetical protein
VSGSRTTLPDKMAGSRTCRSQRNDGESLLPDVLARVRAIGRRPAKVSGQIGRFFESVFPQFPIKAALADSRSRSNSPPVAGKALEEISTHRFLIRDFFVFMQESCGNGFR